MKKWLKPALACVMVAFLLLPCCARGFAEEAYAALKRGDKGEEVKALQERLKELGWYPMKCDGDFGPGTEDAVAAFNKCHGLRGSAATADMQAVAFSDAAIHFSENDEGRGIALDDVADGTYTGTLPGDSYTTTDAPDKYTITSNIAPVEITLTLQGGQVQLYCAASVVAEGTVFGVNAPTSPACTQTLSGTLPLRQVGDTLLYAEGDLTAPGEGVSIYWENKKFTKWEVESRDNSYHCTVSIAMVSGVPTAQVVAAGKISHRACTIPLARKTGAPKADPNDKTEKPLSPFAAQEPSDDVVVLWTNRGEGDVKNDAKEYYVICDLPDCKVTEIETYHYLNGGKAPGELMLFGEDGSEYGPYQAKARDGKNGEKNARWYVPVDIDLPAGRYAVADDDQKTWSNSEETEGWGMATVYGVRKESAQDASSWAGTWDTSFYRMTLLQDGDTVTGSYEYDGGKIEGTVSGNTLSGTWTENETQVGRFVFTLSPDGQSFTGTYGEGDKSTGGAWNGKKE